MQIGHLIEALLAIAAFLACLYWVARRTISFTQHPFAVMERIAGESAHNGSPLRLRGLRNASFFFAACLIFLLGMAADAPWYLVVPSGLLIMGLDRWVERGAHQTLRARVQDNDFRVCPRCEYLLHGLGEHGECPECGRRFSLPALRRYWNDVFQANDHGR